GLTALSAEFTIGEGELMAHDVPLGCAPDEYDDLISGTCSHLPKKKSHLLYWTGLNLRNFGFTVFCVIRRQGQSGMIHLTHESGRKSIWVTWSAKIALTV
ncbi:hypothetical protein, partial [Escherichia coli]|uniref:hypothetical protein n=1 Tax=Escherichia coli TaxID=562 RepID=UPI0034588667